MNASVFAEGHKRDEARGSHRPGSLSCGSAPVRGKTSRHRVRSSRSKWSQRVSRGVVHRSRAASVGAVKASKRQEGGTLVLRMFSRSGLDGSLHDERNRDFSASGYKARTVYTDACVNLTMAVSTSTILTVVVSKPICLPSVSTGTWYRPTNGNVCGRSDRKTSNKPPSRRGGSGPTRRHDPRHQPRTVACLFSTAQDCISSSILRWHK